METELLDVTDPPDVIADAIRLDVFGVHAPAGDLLAQEDGLQHRAVAETRAAHVVDLARPRILIEVIEGVDEIEAVNVVAHLFAVVAEGPVFPAVDGALHQPGEKAVQLRAGVRRSGETTAAKNAGLHA